VVAERKRRQARTRRVRGALAFATSLAAIVLIAGVVLHRDARDARDHSAADPAAADDGNRVKGRARVMAFRQVGEGAERLDEDAVVRVGDVIQLRYNGGGDHYGLIASIDGAGSVTLHYPADDAPPEATAISAGTVTLPHAYQLDDAPNFERFVLVTANAPIDVAAGLAALRALAASNHGGDAALDLPPGQHQAWLRLRKPVPAAPSDDAAAVQDPPRGTP
jgi:hypothetical protein